MRTLVYVMIVYQVDMHIDDNGMSPFYAACCYGHVAVLDWLLAHGLPASEMTRAGKCAQYLKPCMLVYCIYGSQVTGWMNLMHENAC